MRQTLLPILAALICSAAPTTQALAQSSFWQKVDGPGLGCSAITIDRANRIYVQTQDRLYRSLNGGSSWQEDGSQVPGGASVLWSDTDGDLYAGGGEAGGVYRSTDNGATWNADGLGGVAVTSAAVTPDGAILIGTSSYGVFYSSDKGENWAQLLDFAAGGGVNSVAAMHNGDFLAATESGGIFRSVDGGESWIDADGGMPSAAVVDIAVDSQDRLYAATRNKGLFVSTDAGASWELLGMAKWVPGSLTVSGTDAVYATIISPEPALMRSTDHGATWEGVTTGLANAEVHEVVFDNRGYLFASTSRGVFRSVESTSSVDDRLHGVSGETLRLFPNPVALPRTTLEIELKNAGDATVTLASADGSIVATPFEGWLPAGTNRIAIGREGLAAGSYLCSVRTAAGVSSGMLVVE